MVECIYVEDERTVGGGEPQAVPKHHCDLIVCGGDGAGLTVPFTEFFAQTREQRESTSEVCDLKPTSVVRCDFAPVSGQGAKPQSETGL